MGPHSVLFFGASKIDLLFWSSEGLAVNQDPRFPPWGSLPIRVIAHAEDSCAPSSVSRSCFVSHYWCPVLFSQGNSTSWPPRTQVPTRHMDLSTNLLTHQGESWSCFLLRCIVISPYLHGRSYKESSLPKNYQKSPRKQTHALDEKQLGQTR